MLLKFAPNDIVLTVVDEGLTWLCWSPVVRKTEYLSDSPSLNVPLRLPLLRLVQTQEQQPLIRHRRRHNILRLAASEVQRRVHKLQSIHEHWLVNVIFVSSAMWYIFISKLKFPRYFLCSFSFYFFNLHGAWIRTPLILIGQSCVVLKQFMPY